MESLVMSSSPPSPSPLRLSASASRRTPPKKISPPSQPPPLAWPSPVPAAASSDPPSSSMSLPPASSSPSFASSRRHRSSSIPFRLSSPPSSSVSSSSPSSLASSLASFPLSSSAGLEASFHPEKLAGVRQRERPLFCSSSPVSPSSAASRLKRGRRLHNLLRVSRHKARLLLLVVLSFFSCVSFSSIEASSLSLQVSPANASCPPLSSFCSARPSSSSLASPPLASLLVSSSPHRSQFDSPSASSPLSLSPSPSLSVSFSLSSSPRCPKHRQAARVWRLLWGSSGTKETPDGETEHAEGHRGRCGPFRLSVHSSCAALRSGNRERVSASLLQFSPFSLKSGCGRRCMSLVRSLPRRRRRGCTLFLGALLLSSLTALLLPRLLRALRLTHAPQEALTRLRCSDGSRGTPALRRERRGEKGEVSEEGQRKRDGARSPAKAESGGRDPSPMQERTRESGKPANPPTEEEAEERKEERKEIDTEDDREDKRRSKSARETRDEQGGKVSRENEELLKAAEAWYLQQLKLRAAYLSSLALQNSHQGSSSLSSPSSPSSSPSSSVSSSHSPLVLPPFPGSTGGVDCMHSPAGGLRLEASLSNAPSGWLVAESLPQRVLSCLVYLETSPGCKAVAPRAALTSLLTPSSPSSSLPSASSDFSERLNEVPWVSFRALARQFRREGNAGVRRLWFGKHQVDFEDFYCNAPLSALCLRFLLDHPRSVSAALTVLGASAFVAMRRPLSRFFLDFLLSSSVWHNYQLWAHLIHHHAPLPLLLLLGRLLYAGGMAAGHSLQALCCEKLADLEAKLLEKSAAVNLHTEKR